MLSDSRCRSSTHGIGIESESDTGVLNQATKTGDPGVHQGGMGLESGWTAPSGRRCHSKTLNDGELALARML